MLKPASEAVALQNVDWRVYPPGRWTSWREKTSRYMEWAKTRSSAPFNLATSGLTSVPMAEFPLRVEELEITGGGYGYGPLLERIARQTGAPVECIVTAEGTSMANHLAMAALLEPGDEVLIEQPTYGLLLDVANYLGARVKRIARTFENNFDISLAGNGAGDHARDTPRGADQSAQSNRRLDSIGDDAGDRRNGASGSARACWSMKFISTCCSTPRRHPLSR